MKYPSEETHKRSLTRSIVWRVMGIGLLALITYLVTGSWITTTLVTVLHHGIFIIVYYLHERLWLKIEWLRDSRWKPIARVFTYEVILGNGILAIITYLLTSSLQQMSLITFIYIGNKYWMYITFDWLWNRFSWGQNNGCIHRLNWT